MSENQFLETEKTDITPEQEKINHLKAKYGQVYQLVVNDFHTDEELTAYLKLPSRMAIAASMSKATHQPLDANEIILNDAWIEGDERIKKDFRNLLSAITQMSQLLEVKTANLKKL